MHFQEALPKIDIGKLLPVMIAHDEASGLFLDYPMKLSTRRSATTTSLGDALPNSCALMHARSLIHLQLDAVRVKRPISHMA
jgi:hypothetical protein